MKIGLRLSLVFAASLCLLGGVIPIKANENTKIRVDKVENLSSDFIMGTDISTVIAQEQSGVEYKDENGNVKDIFDILKENGVNYIRVRVWNNPYDHNGHGYGAGNSDIEKAIEIGRRATAHGMRLLVDFHYSDFWADPGRQVPPKDWTNMNVSEKSEALYQYTKTSLQKIKAAGVDVGMVQVGNETTSSGIAGEAGEECYQLFAAGAKAVREVDASILIAFHFTNPDKTETILNYAKGLSDHHIDYDVFATSYYSFWHGNLDNLTSVLKTVTEKYRKKTLVAETSYAYTLEDGDGQQNVIRTQNQMMVGGYPASVQGQSHALRDVIDAANKASALGIFYWEPAWTPVSSKGKEVNTPIWEKYGSGWASSAAIGYDPNVNQENYGGSEWDNQALFDFTGKALPSLATFKYVYTGLNTNLKYDKNEEAELQESLLSNSSFEEEDLSDYTFNDCIKRRQDTPKTGKYAMNFYNGANDYTTGIERKITLPAGTYQFSAQIQGGDTNGSEDIYAFARAEAVNVQSEKVKLAGWSNWQTAKLNFTLTKETEVTLGVFVKANKGSWGTIDDLLLTREGVDKTKLGTALSSVKEKLAETMHYTKDSLANLKEQVEEAQAILQKDDATQAEIDAECEALQTAIQALVPLENQSSSNVQHEDTKKTKENSNNKEQKGENSHAGLTDSDSSNKNGKSSQTNRNKEISPTTSDKKLAKTKELLPSTGTSMSYLAGIGVVFLSVFVAVISKKNNQ
ncbi:glycosyl hydrolase 53 family protein [Streptococcus sp. HF-100]|uniref:glycosyl hydrolase 53 family protein n=1 Tax=Streptococcus sp. HF-100 TaxID=2785791 RepID=UPI00189CBD82|nr:glycosyl hydrolase 53 family protein [Streptococcus sp. HF-100]MBF7076741.1 glycosyl hydrolase 53 family protein [Streptococcus sp. HF-100]